MAIMLRYAIAPASMSDGFEPDTSRRYSWPHGVHRARQLLPTAESLDTLEGGDGGTDLSEVVTDDPALPHSELATSEVDRLDAVGALVDRGDAGVAEMLRSAGLLDEAHAAVDLNADRRELDTHVGAPTLRQRGE